MIKKVLVLSVASFVLAGCGKNEVTEEMLIGEWNCQNTVNKEMPLNEASEELIDVPLDPDAPMEFINDDGHVILNFGASIVPFSLKGLEKSKNKWIEFSDNDEMKNNIEFTFISNDEYKLTTGVTIRDAATKEKLRDIYKEVICKRIKD